MSSLVILFAGASLLAPSRWSPIELPAVDAYFISNERVFISSRYPIQNVYLEPNNRNTCFVDEYSHDRREAIVLIRENGVRLTLVVEAGSHELFRKKHTIVIYRKQKCFIRLVPKSRPQTEPARTK